MTRVRAGRPQKRGLIHSSVTRFYPFQKVDTISGGHQAVFSYLSTNFSPELKLLEREAGQLPLSALDNSVYLYYTSLLCLHGLHQDEFHEKWTFISL